MYSAHSFRHFFATDRIKKTNNTKGVSVYLGHASTSTTLDMYTHTELSYNDLIDLGNTLKSLTETGKKQDELF